MKKTNKTAASRAPAIPPAKESKSAPEPVSAPRVLKPIKLVAPAATATVVVAQVDVGFGNILYLRGEGPGLSWEKGLPLECAGGEWTISLRGMQQPALFKLLINDEQWSAGENFTAVPGGRVVIVPSF